MKKETSAQDEPLVMGGQADHGKEMDPADIVSGFLTTCLLILFYSMILSYILGAFRGNPS